MENFTHDHKIFLQVRKLIQQAIITKPLTRLTVLQSKHHLRKLEAIQRLCTLRKISPYSTVSTAAFVEGISPIELLLKAKLCIHNGKRKELPAKDSATISAELKLLLARAMSGEEIRKS